MFHRLPHTLVALLTLMVSVAAAHGADAGSAWDDWADSVDRAMIDAYAPGVSAKTIPPVPDDVLESLKSAEAVQLLRDATGEAARLDSVSAAAGTLRARGQQALVVEMSDAVRAGDVERARLWRARLHKTRGTSSAEGALLLAALKTDPRQRADIAQILAREAITWQTTRARELLAIGAASTKSNVPMPGRLIERFAEALALADLPAALRTAAGLKDVGTLDFDKALLHVRAAVAKPWGPALTTALSTVQREAESSLPSLLTDAERQRREKLILRLAKLVPLEYQAGVRDGQIAVRLEYQEAKSFTAQSRLMLGELVPLWLRGEKGGQLREPLGRLDQAYADVSDLIERKAASSEIDARYRTIEGILTTDFGISLRRAGKTEHIVEETMIEVRDLLRKSLAAAMAGKWGDAEQLRLEAYTTFDPDIEARLMPRDPTLAINIERMLLDGVDQPGIKTLLDRRAGRDELEAAYARVVTAMNQGAALLQTTVDPTAAAINAGSIVLREGLEGLLVVVAIFAGLRGAENARRRRLFWVGIVGSMAATAITWALSLTIITSLNAYAEVIAAVTGIIAIGILLLITNWLFQQVYWKQWVTTLKGQATEGESAWQLVSVGFLVGYREGFETVLFLQSLMMDAGGQAVSIGVAVGCFILLALGFAALKIGLKLPYFKILLVTAVMIGVVLITFVGGTVRAMQTVSWLPVHRFTPGSWPNWTGNWLGLYNTWESIIAQTLTVLSVLGTWRVARWNSKRKTAKRRAEMQEAKAQCPAGAGHTVMARIASNAG